MKYTRFGCWLLHRKARRRIPGKPKLWCDDCGCWR